MSISIFVNIEQTRNRRAIGSSKDALSADAVSHRTYRNDYRRWSSGHFYKTIIEASILSGVAHFH